VVAQQRSLRKSIKQTDAETVWRSPQQPHEHAIKTSLPTTPMGPVRIVYNHAYIVRGHARQKSI